MTRTMATALALMVILTVLVAGPPCPGQDGRSTDVTFLVCADSHYGQDQWADDEALNKEAIDRMNAIPGTLYPASVGGGAIDAPRGVLVAGDLTDTGTWDNWSGYWFGQWREGFRDDYGVNGEGRIAYPVYEGYGNHDIHSPATGVVPTGIIDRNAQRPGSINVSANGLHYSWDWDAVHLVNLNIYPGGAGDAENSLDFLIQDLTDNVGDSGRSVVIYHHYGLDAFSNGWWTQAERKAYHEAIEDYNVVAIFHGHSHMTQYKQWKGIDTYNIGTVKAQRFFVVHITDTELVVAERVGDAWGKKWRTEINNPVPDIMINGQDDPLTLLRTDPVDITVSLDTGVHEGEPADWWVFVTRNLGDTWWWSFPPSWQKSSVPILAAGAPLRSLNGYAVYIGTLPKGFYEFTFAVDEKNGNYEGTYLDTAQVTIY